MLRELKISFLGFTFCFGRASAFLSELEKYRAFFNPSWAGAPPYIIHAFAFLDSQECTGALQSPLRTSLSPNLPY